MKKQNGITLVALVITIIVLLILAGVSISLALGNNGVLTRSSQAVTENEKGTVLQDIKLGAADAITAYWTGWATNASVHKGNYFKDANFSGSATLAETSGVSIVGWNSADKDLSGISESETTTTWSTNNWAEKDSGYICVKYTVKGSGVKYFAVVNVENGDVTSMSPAIAKDK
jgi:hypothetical protein